MDFQELDWDKLSIDKKQLFIGEILNNYHLEEAFKTLNNNKESMEALSIVIKVLIDSIKANRGVVLALKDSNNIDFGQWCFDFIQKSEQGVLQCTTSEKGEQYAFIFTSREDFFKTFPVLSGGVLFWPDALEYIIKNDELDGIIINPGEEEIIFTKADLTTIAMIVGDVIDRGEG